MKTIAVTGATGTQGGSLVQALLEAKEWKVRAITRHPDGQAAKALASQGVEVCGANFGDESSLIDAFRNAHAIFAVTNFWEHLMAGKSQTESGELEEKQSLTLARASAKTTTLEHYIWSTLPSVSNLTNGEVSVPHCDYKATVDQYIRCHLPTLAAKTTYLYFGFYPQNMAYLPFLKPFRMPENEAYVWLMPTKPSTILPIAGDVNKTAGLWVSRILANPQKTRGKYAAVVTEMISASDLLKAWSRGTGKTAIMVECSSEKFGEIWGTGGLEFSLQMKFHERISDMTANLKEAGLYVTQEELGIAKGDFEESSGIFKNLRNSWV